MAEFSSEGRMLPLGDFPIAPLHWSEKDVEYISSIRQLCLQDLQKNEFTIRVS